MNAARAAIDKKTNAARAAVAASVDKNAKTHDFRFFMKKVGQKPTILTFYRKIVGMRCCSAILTMKHVALALCEFRRFILKHVGKSNIRSMS